MDSRMPGWDMMKTLVVLGLLTVALGGCGATDSENSIAPNGTAGGPNMGAGGADDGDAASELEENDLCDDGESIDYGAYSMAAGETPIAASAYVIDLRNGVVAGSTELEADEEKSWLGSIAPAELDPPASCADLATYTDLSLFEYEDGRFSALVNHSPRMLVTADGDPCSAEYSLHLEDADEVVLYGLKPGVRELDGPVPLTSKFEHSWEGSAAEFGASCEQTPNYVYIVVAYRDGKLLGASAEPANTN